MKKTKEDFIKLYNFLKRNEDKNTLFITTSNRYKDEVQIPKSSILADKLAQKLENVEVIDASKLKIYMCEGNVSNQNGNRCGVEEALLQDEVKNPDKLIRCFAALHNEDDELYKVANAIFKSDVVIFFGSIRWGKMNAVYARLIERLTWIENRRSALKQSDLLEGKVAGIVAIGHNWNAQVALNHEKNVLNFIGFKTPDELFFKWEFMKDSNNEDLKKYIQDYLAFNEEFEFINELK